VAQVSLAQSFADPKSGWRVSGLLTRGARGDRYEAEVMAAQAPEPVDHFDRDFLRRLANHASRFDAENAQEDTELNNMTTTLTREHGEIGDSPVVTAKLAEEQAQLDAEAPYDADEHARNKAIVDAIGAERASRGAKEAALASEIQRVRGIVSDLRPRIDGAYSESATSSNLVCAPKWAA
jgi:hypothetical protein